MKKLLFISVFLFAVNKFSYPSFPVDNIENQITQQSEDGSKPSPIINILGMGALVCLIFSYPISIFLHLSKPIPKEKNIKKKFFKKLIFLILIPPVLFISIYAIARYTMFSF